MVDFPSFGKVLKTMPNFYPKRQKIEKSTCTDCDENQWVCTEFDAECGCEDRFPEKNSVRLREFVAGL